MMKISLLICIAYSAWASDDANLMQHGLSLSAETESLQLSIRRIQDGLDQIPNPGKSRQMAIDALMKSVSESDKIDEGAKSVLREIDALLQSILDDLHQENVVDQGILDAITAVIVGCNTDHTGDDATKEGEWNTKRTEHSDCRDIEQDKYQDEFTACGSFVTMMTDFNSGDHCSLPTLDGTLPLGADYTSDWTKKIEDGKAWISGYIPDFTTEKNACENAMNELDIRRGLCNTDQREAENAFCLWRVARNFMCTTRSTCYSDAVSAHNGQIATIKVNGDTRVNEARLIHHVKCLLKALEETGATNANACDSSAADEASYQTLYNVTFPTYDAEAACDQSAVAVYPSGANNHAWANAFLSEFAPGPPAGEHYVQSPVDPAYTSCSA